MEEIDVFESSQGSIRSFELENMGLQIYTQKLPHYDSLLFQTLSLDVWDPEDYPIINIDWDTPANQMKHLLPENSKMFRFSQSRTYFSGLWYVIYRSAPVIEKFIFEADTTFELKFNYSNGLEFSLTTENKEFHFGSLPLYFLHFCTISVRLPRELKLKIVFDDLVHIEDLEKAREYLDDRLFRVGDELLISRYGTCEKYFSEDDDYRRVKPLMDPNRRKMISYLAMLFFEEVGVNPEFIVAKSSFLM